MNITAYAMKILDDEAYAKVAYDAYCESRGWVSVRGDPLPPFEAQSPELKSAWGFSARAVVEKFTTPE